MRQAFGANDPETRLRLAAGVARQIRGAQSAVFDLMRGAGVVAPELAKLQQQRERLRYEKEEGMINFLRDSGRLRPGLSYKAARDIFWMLTGGGCVPHAGVRASVVSPAVPGLAGRHFGALPACHGGKPEIRFANFPLLIRGALRQRAGPSFEYDTQLWHHWAAMFAIRHRRKYQRNGDPKY